MAWPQAPAPQPAPPSGGAGAVPIPAILTAVGGVLTFLFSFVRIVRVDESVVDTGWSVWTTDFTPGLFGVGTWIPFFALVAAGIAVARIAVKGLDDKEILGFRPAQLQLVAVVFAVLIWLGYVISILFAGGGLFNSVDFKFGLGIVLLFLGLLLTAAGTVMGLLAPSAAAAVGAGTSGSVWGAAPTPPPPGEWQPPADPGAAAQAQWEQPAPGTAETGQWQPPPDPGAAQQSWE